METNYTVRLMAKLLQDIRTAIRESEYSRYRIAKETGVHQSQLAKLMTGETGLSIASLERLADFLDLEIVLRPKRAGRKR